MSDLGPFATYYVDKTLDTMLADAKRGMSTANGWTMVTTHMLERLVAQAKQANANTYAAAALTDKERLLGEVRRERDDARAARDCFRSERDATREELRRTRDELAVTRQSLRSTAERLADFESGGFVQLQSTVVAQLRSQVEHLDKERANNFADMTKFDEYKKAAAAL